MGSRRLLDLGDWRPGISIRRQSQQPVRLVRSRRQDARNVGAPGNYRTADLSPDGQRLAYNDVNLRDIWISICRDRPRRVSPAILATDGARLVSRREQDRLPERFRRSVREGVAGPGTGRLLLKANSVNGPYQVVLGWQVDPVLPRHARGNQDVIVLPMTGDRKPQMIVQTPFPDVEPQFSPDVRWLAYASSENGRNEVYVQAFPSTGRRWQVSSAGGRQPLWRADGKELFFVSDERKFYAVDVSEKDGIFQYGVPQFLFDMRANVFNTRNSYIPNRDGTRFLVNMLLDADVLADQHRPELAGHRPVVRRQCRVGAGPQGFANAGVCVG